MIFFYFDVNIASQFSQILDSVFQIRKNFNLIFTVERLDVEKFEKSFPKFLTCEITFKKIILTVSLFVDHLRCCNFITVLWNILCL